MSDELDRRAALAMGWAEVSEDEDNHWFIRDGGELMYIGGSDWSPSTNRNDLAELLREVERLGLDHKMATKMFDKWADEAHKGSWIWLLTADPAIVCLAAVEVLEAANE